MKRIISLIPSSTEMVCALGAAEQLVGISHECDFPVEVKSLPVCSAPKYEPDGTCYQINERIKALLQEGLSIYRLDAEQLNELAPDVIITQTQCEVCAVSLADVEAATCEMVGSRPEIVALSPNCLEDVYADIHRVALALDRENRGQQLVADMRQRMAEISAKVPSGEPVRVLCLEWLQPMMAGGNWLPQLTAMAGVENLFGEAGKHSPWLKSEEVLAADPDVLILIPCGYSIETIRANLDPLVSNPMWQSLRAVRENRVYLADGNRYFNRPGPRLVNSLEILVEILYPEHFDFGHRDDGWCAL